MADWISRLHRVYGRVGSAALFAFRPEVHGKDGVRPDPLRDRQTRLGRRFGTRLFSRCYPGVPGRLHIHDTMLRGDSPEEIAHYIHVGKSAIRNIEAALGLAGRSFADLEYCLDMACGYGRVLRWLVQLIPPERITACELVDESIRFCHEEFGVEALLSELDLRSMRFPRNYDLIWVGSLFTHLMPGEDIAFLQVLARALNPRGMLLLSTQGPSCLNNIPMYGSMFRGKTEEFRAQLKASGVAYLPYFASNPNYGIALHTPDYLDRALAGATGERVRRFYYAERGWDDHQDVNGFQRVGD